MWNAHVLLVFFSLRLCYALACPSPICSCEPSETDESLQIIYCASRGIISVPIFSTFTNRSTLYLDNNGITSLRSGAFANLPSLLTISLLDNPLVSVEPGTFSGLEDSLKLLKLGPSAFTTAEGSATVFSNILIAVQNLNNLLELFIQNIAVASSWPSPLSPLFPSSLTSLVLQTCQISFFPENVFSGLNSLLHLDLSDNLLTSFPRQALQPLGPHLEVLILSLNNRILSLSSVDLDQFSSLRELQLDQLNISEIPPNLFLPVSNSLQFLDFSLNRLGAGSTASLADALLPLNSLETLHLRGCQITQLPPNFLQNQNTLHELDLGLNLLGNLSSSDLSDVRVS